MINSNLGYIKEESGFNQYPNLKNIDFIKLANYQRPYIFQYTFFKFLEEHNFSC